MNSIKFFTSIIIILTITAVLVGSIVIDATKHDIISWSLSALNICAFVFLTYVVAEDSNRSTANRFILDKQHSIYESYYIKIHGAYVNYMESPNKDNECYFDEFAQTIHEYIREMMAIDIKWKESDEVIWWRKEFERVKRIYSTTNELDATILSQTWSEHLSALFSECSKVH